MGSVLLLVSVLAVFSWRTVAARIHLGEYAWIIGTWEYVPDEAAEWRTPEEVEAQGRRHFTGTALHGESGECRGVALGLWFEVEPATVPRD